MSKSNEFISKLKESINDLRQEKFQLIFNLTPPKSDKLIKKQGVLTQKWFWQSCKTVNFSDDQIHSLWDCTFKFGKTSVYVPVNIEGQPLSTISGINKKIKVIFDVRVFSGNDFKTKRYSEYFSFEEVVYIMALVRNILDLECEMFDTGVNLDVRNQYKRFLNNAQTELEKAVYKDYEVE